MYREKNEWIDKAILILITAFIIAVVIAVTVSFFVMANDSSEARERIQTSIAGEGSFESPYEGFDPQDLPHLGRYLDGPDDDEGYWVIEPDSHSICRFQKVEDGAIYHCPTVSETVSR